MAAERISILYNPSAGMGRALKKKLKLEHLLKHFEVRYDLTMTRSEEHLRQLTREHARAYATVVGAGGDSTFHLMVNELVRAGTDVGFGMIGVGSSNDIALEFGLDSLDEACRALKAAHVRKIDLGCILEGNKPLAYFIGQANIGIGAFVNKYVADLSGRKLWLARRQTLAGILGIRQAYRSRRIPLRLKLTAEACHISGDYISIVFSNIKYWATGKIINPAALADDGRLDGCFVQHCSFPRLYRISSLASKGRHGKAREVKFYQAPQFEVAAESPFEIQSDGEIVKTAEGRTSFQNITVAVLPQALKIICPDNQ
jgi:diacylglycerol kinase family enzyme